MSRRGETEEKRWRGDEERRAHHRPSLIIRSFIFQSPMRIPSREPCITCGVADMFSWPPATISEASPHLMACAASITALRPLPQTLSMVIDGTSCGKPAPTAACRAGF